jgi:sec-independent protein translocase protein TatA
VPFDLGIWEIIILVGVLVLLFGTKGAPAMARRLGTGIREMKDAVADMNPRSLLDPKDEPVVASPRRELEAAAEPAPPAEPNPSATAKPEQPSS